jgi:predicted SAM-dependent methyltransferase
MLFHEQYIRTLPHNELLVVVEFGSYNVNGTLRTIFEGCNYIGIDLESGPGVDIVCPGDETPLKRNSVDVVLSSSNFEHDECFWMTFIEMCRILKPGGYLYINAPSAGPYHGYPGDCWRFYEDSWRGLVKWAAKLGYNMNIVETYLDDRSIWKDNICIFSKQ